MRKFATLLALLITTSISFSQTEERKPISTTTYPINSPESDSLKSVQIYIDSINYEIMLIDQHLNSIQIKWDWIMNNPEEKVIAEQEGWFEKMTIVREELEEKKKLLIDSKK